MFPPGTFAPLPATSPRSSAASYSSANRRLASASMSRASTWGRWTAAMMWKG